MKKIGIFLDGVLVIDYPYDIGCYEEALKDLGDEYAETGVMHELRILEVD